MAGPFGSNPRRRRRRVNAPPRRSPGVWIESPPVGAVPPTPVAYAAACRPTCRGWRGRTGQSGIKGVAYHQDQKEQAGNTGETSGKESRDKRNSAPALPDPPLMVPSTTPVCLTWSRRLDLQPRRRTLPGPVVDANAGAITPSPKACDHGYQSTRRRPSNHENRPATSARQA